MRRLGLAWVLVASGALAYVLPAGSILRRLVERRADLQLSTLKVTGSLLFAGESTAQARAALGVPGDKPEITVDGAVYLKVPGRCRIEASSVEGNRLSATALLAGKRRVEGEEIPALSAAVEQLCPLLALRSSSESDARAAVERQLARIKVEGRKTSLERFKDQVVYVLGDAAPGAGQLWIYKDSFLPARVRFTDEAGAAWDVSFVDFAAPAAGEWFPRVLEVHKNGKLAMRLTALNGDGRAKLDDKLF